MRARDKILGSGQFAQLLDHLLRLGELVGRNASPGSLQQNLTPRGQIDNGIAERGHAAFQRDTVLVVVHGRRQLQFQPRHDGQAGQPLVAMSHQYDLQDVVRGRNRQRALPVGTAQEDGTARARRSGVYLVAR